MLIRILVVFYYSLIARKIVLNIVDKLTNTDRLNFYQKIFPGIEAGVMISPGVRFYSNSVQINSQVVLGNNAKIYSAKILKGTYIGAGAQLGSDQLNEVIEVGPSAWVGAGSKVFANLGSRALVTKSVTLNQALGNNQIAQNNTNEDSLRIYGRPATN